MNASLKSGILVAFEISDKAEHEIEKGRCCTKVIDLKTHPSLEGDQHPFKHAKHRVFVKRQAGPFQRRYYCNVVRCCPCFTSAGETSW